MRTTQTFPTLGLNTLAIKGEEFVLLKKEHLQELVVLFNSIVSGEKLLRGGKTRTFAGFLKSISKKNR